MNEIVKEQIVTPPVFFIVAFRIVLSYELRMDLYHSIIPEHEDQSPCLLTFGLSHNDPIQIYIHKMLHDEPPLVWNMDSCMETYLVSNDGAFFEEEISIGRKSSLIFWGDRGLCIMNQ